MLILITGLPGSGKSTVARLLGEALDAEVLKSDLIRRELFPVARTYTSEETQRVIAETERRVTDFLKQGRTVILDALFTKQRPRDQYRAFAETVGVAFCIVHVHASDEQTQSRLEERARKGDASEATYDYYLDRKNHFEPVQGEHLTIDNAGTAADLAAQVADLAKAISNIRQRPRG